MWRNKADLDTMSIDDLYNNLEGVKSSQEIQTTRTRKAQEWSVPVETFTSTALVSCDGLSGYDWSDQAKEGPNYALIFGLLISKIDGGYVAFRGNPKGGKITGKRVQNNNNHFCEMKGILRQIVWQEPTTNESFAERMNMDTKMEAAKTMLADPKFLTTFSLAEADLILLAMLQNRVFSNWLFDIDALTRTMNYDPITAGTQSNGFTDPKSSHDDGSKPSSDNGKKVDEDPRKDSECNDQEKEENVNSTNNVNVASTNEVNVVGGKTSIEFPDDLNMPALEDYSIFYFTRNDEDDGVMVDMNNLYKTIQDERGIVIRNKARLVAQGYIQEEGINYDEVFATVVRIKAIRLFLAYASIKNFMVYQMDVKSVFLYGKIEEEVYVCQPPGFGLDKIQYFPRSE
ncbi:retrovirus-related pol polyprotein from transposon TNT 1-94 [Tanacetum coccineum]